MKYLKTFEDVIISGITFKYNVGDYVLLSEEVMNKNTKDDNTGPHGLQTFQVKIINIRLKENGEKYPYPYIVETYDNDQCVVKDNEIVRKLTYNEIKNYKLKKQTTKYNI
jgi:hypothetical protein